jgi:hypothetical protein
MALSGLLSYYVAPERIMAPLTRIRDPSAQPIPTPYKPESHFLTFHSLKPASASVIICLILSKEALLMGGYFRILAAIPGFFLSTWFLMLLWGVISNRLGLSVTLSYVNAMLVTITLWLAVAPLAAAGRKS